jgi:hypothetical protein
MQRVADVPRERVLLTQRRATLTPTRARESYRPIGSVIAFYLPEVRMRLSRALPLRLSALRGCVALAALACVPPVVTAPPTNLPRFPGDYIDQPEEFVRIADAAGWDGGEYASRAVCGVRICPRPDMADLVQIDAVVGVKDIGSPQNPASPWGTVIARVWNRYGAADSDFGARPRARMYLVLLPWHGEHSPGLRVAHLLFVEVWQEEGRLRLRYAARGTYKQCPWHKEPVPLPSARFGKCTPATESHRRVGVGGGGMRGPAVADVLRLLDPQGEAQVHCPPTGCCEAN